MSAILILTAAGSSTRMGGEIKKEYLTIREEGESRISVLSSALHAFLATSVFSIIVITVPVGGEPEAKRVLAEDRRIALLCASQHLELHFAEGGASRQASVLNGLETASRISAGMTGSAPEYVLIHDGARPWVSACEIDAVLDVTAKYGAAVPGIPSIDTQKETDETGKILRHLDRSRIVSVQTPQGFRFEELLAAHRKASDDGRIYTDDTEIWGRYAGDVYVSTGSRDNRKITYPGDV